MMFMRGSFSGVWRRDLSDARSMIAPGLEGVNGLRALAGAFLARGKKKERGNEKGEGGVRGRARMAAI